MQNIENILKACRDIEELRKLVAEAKKNLQDAETELASLISGQGAVQETFFSVVPERQLLPVEELTPSDGGRTKDRPFRDTQAGRIFRYTGTEYIQEAMRQSKGIPEYSERTKRPIAIWVTVDELENIRHTVYLRRAQQGHKVPDKYLTDLN